MLNMTVKKFADYFLPSNTKVKVVQSCKVLFDGTLEEFYYHGSEVFELVVSMVGADEDKVCLSCRKWIGGKQYEYDKWTERIFNGYHE